MGWLLVPIIVVAIVISIFSLYVFFRFRGSDYLIIVFLFFPVVWLNRLDLHYITLSSTPFYLIWGVLISFTLVLVWFGNKFTSGLLSSFTFKLGILFFLLITFFVAGILLYAETDNDLIRGFHAICYVILPLIAMWSVVRCCSIDEERIQHAIEAFLIMGGIVGLMAITTALAPSLFRGIISTYKTTQTIGRAFTPLGGPSATAMCLLPVYCLSVGQLMMKRKPLFNILIISICFLGILSTLARAVILSFIITNIYLFSRYRQGWLRRMVVLSLLSSLVLLPLLYGLGSVFSLDRLTSGDARSNHSISARVASLKAATIYGLKHPILGGGWGLVYPESRTSLNSIGSRRMTYLEGHITASKPHSLFALVFAESGAVSLTILILIFWQFWRGMRPPEIHIHSDGHTIAHSFRSGFLAFIAMCTMQDHLFLTNKIPLFFYLFAFLGIAACTFYRETAIAHETYPAISEGEIPNPNHPELTTRWA